jgi:hypothetical protein
MIKIFSEKGLRENKNTFCDKKCFFGKSCLLRNNVEKYCSALECMPWD